MAEFTNFLILTYVLAFVVMMGYATAPGAQTYEQKYGFKSNVSDTAQRQVTSIDNQMNEMKTPMVITNVPIFGTVVFPNPFAIFIGIFTILLSIVSAPFDIIGGLDLPVILIRFLQGILLVIGIYLGYTWFKGQTK